jgi:UDP-3-O-[3-hydroxymyristoyl] glucosamine N-acyltransferase
MPSTLDEIARLVGGVVVGEGSIELTGVAGITEAVGGELTFLSNPRYEKFVAGTSASAILVSEEQRDLKTPEGVALLVVEDPYEAVARVMSLFAPEGDLLDEGVHETAVVSDSAGLGPDVAVGAHAVIMDGVEVGEGTRIHAGSYIGRDCRVGRDCVLYQGVKIRYGCEIGDRVIVHPGTVIGSDGFGFADTGRRNTKVPQIGNVVIEDDVEIGANVCIDRATLGSTRISRGSKIDNLVQIGHNVVVGEGAVVVAQVGIAGSTTVGRGAVLGGQAGLVGHIEIGDGAMIGAQAGVTRSIPPGERVSGYPARKHSTAKRLHAMVEHLPTLVARVKELAERVEKMEEERKKATGSASPDKRET